MLRNADSSRSPSRRTWGWMNFAAFWISDGLNLNTFMIASNRRVGGIDLESGLGSYHCGLLCSGVPRCNDRENRCCLPHFVPYLGEKHFRCLGAIWPIINRSGMACIWYGVQSYIGGQCVTLVLRSIFPSYARIPNHPPKAPV